MLKVMDVLVLSKLAKNHKSSIKCLCEPDSLTVIINAQEEIFGSPVISCTADSWPKKQWNSVFIVLTDFLGSLMSLSEISLSGLPFFIGKRNFCTTRAKRKYSACRWERPKATNKQRFHFFFGHESSAFFSSTLALIYLITRHWDIGHYSDEIMPSFKRQNSSAEISESLVVQVKIGYDQFGLL